MGLQRRSRFGFPPQTPPSSQYTVREVPLSQGPRGDVPWTLLPPGSATSMTNWLPMNGRLVPRSRLSSLNTQRPLEAIRGMSPRYSVSGSISNIWLSAGTRHGQINSNGSISVASFTSAFGLGVAGIEECEFLWDHATAFMGSANEYVLITAPGVGSYSTLLVTYGSSSADFRTSYLTSAPKAQWVGTFDNYVVAWNITSSSGNLVTRVQWCQRGDPSNWTGEGSGFEDLLEMRGRGNRVLGTQDNRLILFSSDEIWYGLPATYPAQFQFYPLDRSVGLCGSHTAVETDLGVIFLGTDLCLRLLPRGGGPSQPIAPSMREELRKKISSPAAIGLNVSWAVYDPILRLYYLFLDPSLDGTRVPFVLNVDTGEWGRIHYPANPYIGCTVVSPSNSAVAGGVFFGNSSGTVFSQNSKLTVDTPGGVVTAIWDSPVIAQDLPANYKQITQLDVDYRSTSTASLSVNISQNAGATFFTTSVMTLPPAHIAGRATDQQYLGGAFPVIRLSSANTGIELHRLDVTMTLGGRRA